MDNQIIFVLTAASATGKTSCAKLACAQDPCLVQSVSYSTRPQRPGEVEGIDKYFISEAAFDALQASDEFVEQTRIFGHRCGHTQSVLTEIAAGEKDILMILDYQGLCQIKAKYPNTVSIFLLPPDSQAIIDRIQKRPEAKGVDIGARLESAKREMQDYTHYDYVVINDQLEQAVADLLAIVAAERLKTKRQVLRHAAVIKALTDMG